MTGHRVILICFILLFVIIESDGKLKFVQTIFRHGNRTPVWGTDAKYFPNNPYSEKDWAPLESGVLTEKGKDNSFELGRYFKKVYGSWLDVDNRNDTADFHTNAVERTIITAKLVASGLYSKPFDNRFNASRNWETIPVETISKEDMWFYKSTEEGYCANFDKQLEIAEKTPAVAKYLEETRDFHRTLSERTGYNGTYKMTFILYVMLFAEADIGLKLPEWTEPMFSNGELREAAGMQYSIFGSTDELKKIGGGLWIREWLNNIDKFLTETNSPTKAKFYSGHDMNLGSILVTLDAFDEPHVPVYNSAIMFELHEIHRQHFIKVLYKQGDTLQALVIFGCRAVLCPLETVKEYAAKVISDNPREDCDPLPVS